MRSVGLTREVAQDRVECRARINGAFRDLETGGFCVFCVFLCLFIVD